MERIGIYGGTFNPPHLGHFRAARHAAQVLQLDRLLLIPDRIAPHKEIPEGSPTPWQRLEMVRLGTEDFAEVSDLELRREGPSYTVDTLRQLAAGHPELKVAKVHVDQQRELARKHKVFSIPTLVIYKNGEITARASGVRPVDEILSLI